MSHPRRFTAAQLRGRVGQEVLVSDWLQVDQNLINRFADATGDRQWIHVDEPRAARESLYGSTLAHGFLVLSLIPRLGEALFTAAGLRLSLNYGLNRGRFVRPVRAQSPRLSRYVPEVRMRSSARFSMASSSGSSNRLSTPMAAERSRGPISSMSTPGTVAILSISATAPGDSICSAIRISSSVGLS